MRYESVAPVLPLCDVATPSSQHALTAISAHPSATDACLPRSERLRGPRNNGGANRQQNQRRQVAPNRHHMHSTKNRSACFRCGNYGHWYSDHNQDDSLRYGTASRPASIVEAVNEATFTQRRQPCLAVAAPDEAASPVLNDGPEMRLSSTWCKFCTRTITSTPAVPRMVLCSTLALHIAPLYIPTCASSLDTRH